MNYVLGALDNLMPRLFELLTQQEDYFDPSEWSPSKAATTCIGEIALLCRDEILAVRLSLLAYSLIALPLSLLAREWGITECTAPL